MDSSDEVKSFSQCKSNSIDTTHINNETYTNSIPFQQASQHISSTICSCEDNPDCRYVKPKENRAYSQSILTLLNIRVNNSLNLHFENKAPLLKEEMLFEDLLSTGPTTKNPMDNLLNSGILDSCMHFT